MYMYRPYIPPKALDYLKDVIESGCLAGTCNRYVKKFEEELGKFLGIRNVIATSSGTAALHVAYRAVGVGPGKIVAVPGFTFVATASTVLHANGVPLFVDIDPETLFVDLRDLEKKLRKYNPDAVCVVHIGGVPGPVDQVKKLCDEHGIPLIEDCAQALGARYLGQHVGKFGIVSTFSFYPTKTITTGEGGAVATDDDNIAQVMRLLVSHGEERRYYYIELGYNYRMSELQAALGLAQLEIIDKLIETRRIFATKFIEEVQNRLGDLVIFQKVLPNSEPAWNLIQIILKVEKIRKSRDKILAELRAAGLNIFTVAYPIPLPETPLFRYLRGHGLGCPYSCQFLKVKIGPDTFNLPNCKYVCERILTMLVPPNLTEDDAAKIAEYFCNIIEKTS